MKKVHTESFFSARIKKIRKDNNLKQSEIAGILRIGKSTYQYYERGERIPPADFLLRIVTTYGINSTWLLTGEGEMFVKEAVKTSSDLADDELELVSNYRHLTPIVKGEVRGYVRGEKSAGERSGDCKKNKKIIA